MAPYGAAAIAVFAGSVAEFLAGVIAAGTPWVLGQPSGIAAFAAISIFDDAVAVTSVRGTLAASWVCWVCIAVNSIACRAPMETVAGIAAFLLVKM